MIRADQVARWCRGQWKGAEPASFSGVMHDSRMVGEGMLYVAIQGERFDGHDFLAAARSAGATAAVVQSACQVPRDFPVFVTPDTRRALMDMARGHRGTLPGMVVGVTGSVGKTTVKEMIADMLACSASTARTRGNWNNELGLPLSLLAMRQEDRFGVFEAGINHPGEMRTLAQTLAPDWAVITPIGMAHIEFFPSVEAIAREKSEMLGALTGCGGAVLDADCKWYRLLRERVGGRCVAVTLQATGQADYRGCIEAGGGVLHVTGFARKGLRVRLPMPGLHVARNILLVLALGCELGLEPQAMVKALEGFQPTSMRWCRETAADVCFINDAYNANPMSMRAALSAFGGLAGPGRKWLALGGMHELGACEREEHLEVGRLVASGPWEGVVLVGRRAAIMAEGACAAGFPEERVHVCDTHEEGARALLDAGLSAGDWVLLKGSRGERMEEVRTCFAGLRGVRL